MSQDDFLIGVTSTEPVHQHPKETKDEPKIPSLYFSWSPNGTSLGGQNEALSARCTQLAGEYHQQKMSFEAQLFAEAAQELAELANEINQLNIAERNARANRRRN